MHTATRLFLKLVERVRAVNPRACLCAYGLYAPLNEAILRRVGVRAVLGGEFEAGLAALARALAAGRAAEGAGLPLISLEKLRFLPPDRSGTASPGRLCPPGDGRRHAARGIYRGQPRVQALVPALSRGAGVSAASFGLCSAKWCWRISGGRWPRGPSTSPLAIRISSTVRAMRWLWWRRWRANGRA